MLEKSENKYVDPLIAIAILIFGYWFLIQNDEFIFVSDAQWATHIYASIVYDGNTSLTEFEPSLEAQNYFAVFPYDGETYSYFPLGTPVVATPVLFVLDRFVLDYERANIYEHLKSTHYFMADETNNRLHLLTASFFVALSAVVLYLIGRYYLSIPLSLVLVTAFIFGTTVYSTASRALWQHGPSVLFLALTLWLIVRTENGKKGIAFAGLTVAIAYIIRPSNSLAVLFVSLYILIFHTKYLFRYLATSVPIALLFFAYNYSVLDAPFHPYYIASRLGITPTFVEALAGNIISPARGLFIFSPFLIALPALIIYAAWQRKLKPLEIILIIIVVLHWVSISMFGHWWGGFSYGPRFFTDMVPIMFVLMASTLSTYLESNQRTKLVNGTLASGFLVLSVCSITIHHWGVIYQEGRHWNSQPASVDLFPERIWHWDDIQFLRPFNPNVEPAVSLSALTTEEDQTTMTLQVSNSSQDIRFWEVWLVDGVQIVEKDQFKFTELDNKDLVARFHHALSPSTSYLLDVQFPSSMVTSGNFLMKIRSYDEENELVGERYVPLAVNPAEQTVSYGLEFPVGQLQYGQGWYPVEQAGDFQYRWSKSPSKIYVKAEADQQVQLDMVFGEMYDTEVENGKGRSGKFVLTDANGGQTEFDAEIGLPVSVPVELQEGVNELSLSLVSGNFSPNALNEADSDRRVLSFILSSLAIR